MTARPVDLAPYLNARVATFDAERSSGGLNAWGNSFPAEELPFGSALEVGGVRFRLAAKGRGQPDSVEPLGQRIDVPETPAAAGIALLGCGEMGDQRVALRVRGPRGELVADLVATVRGAMVPAGVELDGAGFAGSHLHYPGDYDLALALPVAWLSEHRWDRPAPVARLELGTNPLFHLLAITLLAAG